MDYNMKNLEKIFGSVKDHEKILKELADLLISAEIDVNKKIKGTGGRTILHLCKNARVLKFILDLGADPFIKDDDGYTALDLAVNLGNVQMINILSSRMYPLGRMGKV